MEARLGFAAFGGRKLAHLPYPLINTKVCATGRRDWAGLAGRPRGAAPGRGGALPIALPCPVRWAKQARMESGGIFMEAR